MLGHMAYLLEGMRRLPAVRSYRMKVMAEEMEVEGDFIFWNGDQFPFSGRL